MDRIVRRFMGQGFIDLVYEANVFEASPCCDG